MTPYPRVSDRPRIAVVGLGYVGLPLAVAFGRRYLTVGFDISAQRTAQLRQGRDVTREVSDAELAAAAHLTFAQSPQDLAKCTVFVITVPTPIDDDKQPDLTPLRTATETVAKILKAGDTVIVESTVYPGTTEEVCGAILSERSGMKLNEGFFLGYSPERINPGDKAHRLSDIVKVTSGSTPQIADFVDDLYRSIVAAGTHRARSIRVAEAAKVIENTQRDLNIALINELAIIFERLDIDTMDVLEAAGSKWNFLPFRPGLVGGHCIGVDPYYLTHKALQAGYHPEVILAGREMNDAMGAHVAHRVVKLMTRKKIQVADSKILVLGLTFKENCPDLRNTRVTDIIDELASYHATVQVFDPWVDVTDARAELGIEPLAALEDGQYDAVVLAVAHDHFRELGIERLRQLGRSDHVFFDVKSMFPRELVDDRL